ncbi:terpene cyclase/mutase family protein [Verrucomicrobiales bacterium]|nr:terpene cyclase/mutase family protein [Verrucomicrobiales bacterium]MDC0275640.1 terpene cyclase/mutase family protein [Verrucomicrobiales bacterium]MDC0312209.1 terpene cyclase/mutase family protein [bacterium]MDC0322149.1 terpene cyclase/mutase family protein [Verrucomicrobiales bacterium]
MVALVFGANANAQSLSNAVFQKHREPAEKAVEKALRYLADNQQQDGTFNDSYGRSTGVVALVGMAYLSAGYTPGYGEFSENLDRCIDYTLAHQKSNGLIDNGDSGHGLMYAHNIATLFLSEVSGMVGEKKQKELDKILGKATKLLLSAQSVPKNDGHKGGWRYKPDSRDSDLSCSGWALMALRSAKLNGAPVPDEAIKKAVEYVLKNHDKESGRFGYTDPWGHSETLTGCGLLCLELCGYHGTPSTFKSGDFILQNRQKVVNNAHEYYANYYNSQGMFQLGGKYWEQYADWMYNEYLGKQNANGSWSNGRNGGTYGTAMMILSFTVPYRQLPIYQRDETVDEG